MLEVNALVNALVRVASACGVDVVFEIQCVAVACVSEWCLGVCCVGGVFLGMKRLCIFYEDWLDV